MVYMGPPPKRGQGKSGEKLSRAPSKEPSKGQASKGPPPKGQPRRGGGPAQSAQDKADLLAQLTRQAEVNTRILERERAQLLAMGIQEHTETQSRFGGGLTEPSALQNQPPWPEGPPLQYYPQPQMRQDDLPPRPPPVRVPQRSRGADAGNRIHNFMGGPGRVYDPQQVPGLGGPPEATAFPMASAGSWGRNGGADEDAVGPAFFAEDDPGNQTQNPEATFPDSPSFQPGMVFSIPGQPGPPGPPPGPPSFGGPGVTLAPPTGGRGKGRGPGAPTATFGVGATGGPEEQTRPGGGRHSRPSAAWRQPQGGSKEERAAIEVRQEAYRRELEEQIRQKQEAAAAQGLPVRGSKAAHARAAPLAIPPPRAYGGGGEPIRMGDGSPMVDLRMAHQNANLPPPGFPPHAPPASWGNHLQELPAFTGGVTGAPMGGNTLDPHMMGAMPGGATAQQPPLHAIPPGMAAPGMPPPYFAGPSPLAVPDPGAMGWGGQGGGSPNGRAAHHKHMSALNELRAGPSEEQKRHKEAARAQLARDLEEQIRQKREREARRKAEEAAQVEKEEAELRAFHAQIEAQKEEERRAVRAQEQAKEMQKAKMAEEQQASSEQVFKPGKGPARRGNKKLIEADWLEPPKQPPAALRSDMEASKSVVGVLPGPIQERVMGARKAMGAQQASVNSGEGVSFGHFQPDEGSLVQPKASHAHSRLKAPDLSDVDGNGIAQLLSALQAEQVRLREDFHRQADAMDRLAKDAGAAALERDKAWQEVERVRGALAGHAAMAPSPSLGANLQNAGGGWSDGQAHASVDEARQSLKEAQGLAETLSDALGRFLVSTHLLPREANQIPTRLSTPLEASWAAQREPLLVHKSRSSDRPLHGSPPEPELQNLEAQGSFVDDGLSEENAYNMYGRQASSPPKQARLQFNDDLWQDDPAGIHHAVHSYGLEPMPSASPLQLAGVHHPGQASPSMIPKPPNMQPPAKRPQQSRGNSFFHGLDASKEGGPGARRALPIQPPPIDVSGAGRRRNMDRGRSPAILTSNHMPSPQEGGGKPGGRGRAVGGGAVGDSLGNGAPARTQYNERPAVSKAQQQRLQEQQQQRLESHLPKQKAGVGVSAAGGVGAAGTRVSGSHKVGAVGGRGEMGSSALLQQQRLDQHRSQQQMQQQQQQQSVDGAAGLGRQRTSAGDAAGGRASSLALRVPSAHEGGQGPSSLSSGPPSHPSKQPMRRGWDAPLVELQQAEPPVTTDNAVTAGEVGHAGQALLGFSGGGLSASKQQQSLEDPFLAHSTLPIHRVEGHLSMGEMTMDDVGAAAAAVAPAAAAATAEGGRSKPGAEAGAEETDEEYTPVPSPTKVS